MANTKMFALLALFAILGSAQALKNTYPTPGETFESKAYTTWSKRVVGKSRRADIVYPFTASDGSSDSVSMIRLDLVGSVYDRGFAHGKLLTKEILEFTGPQLDKFYAQEVLNIDLSSFPEPLQSVLRALQLKGAKAAPEIFKLAMDFVWETEKQYVPSYFFDEINGMGAGICETLGSGCNATEWAGKIQQFNMLPELIRMACTAYGAWGQATANNGIGGLVQLRALDFGSGPFANYSVIAVHRGDVDHSDNAFVTVSFPGFVGVVTGVSQSGIGISEKVWMTYDKRSLQPGSYHGEADVFVLRDILQNSKTKEEAEAYVNSIPRTWAIWIGIGDYKSQKLDLVGYQQSSVVTYNDVTMPSMTGQPFISEVAYVDKHPQPSHSTDLPEALQDFYGNISCESSKTITKFHQTGDVHIASYDFTANHMYVAIGKVNSKGQYGPEGSSNMDQWKAYNRPFVKFNLNELWQGL